jgi:hypothetical protein
MQLRTIERKQITLRDHAEDKQYYSAHSSMRVYLAVRRARRPPLGQGKRHCHAHDEHKERPDPVKKVQPLPGNVFELRGDPVGRRTWEDLCERLQNGRATDDPKHIEAA